MSVFAIHSFPLLCAALAVLTYVLPSRLGWRGKALWTLVFLAGGSKFIVFETLGGHRFAPELPEAAIWAVSFVNGFLYAVVALSLVWWTRRGRRVLLPLLAVLLTAWGQWEALRVPRVREVALSFPNLPAELDGYRILQISDIHCCSQARAWRTRRIVELANAARADLICLTGDYVDARVADCAADMRPLKDLRSRDGVWCVTGNHEFYLDGHRWEKWYRENGFRFLVNACVHPRAHLALAGVNDSAVAHYGGYGNLKPDAAAAFRGSRPGDFRVLLEHRPENFRANVRQCGVDLQLSGHTHGGLAPLVNLLVRMKNGGFVRGLYREGASYLHVSAGAGIWAGAPLRFLGPGEMTVLTLRRGSAVRTASAR